MRITQNHLAGLVNRLNDIVNQPAEAMTDGRFNPGAFSLSYAYGGVCLVRITSTGGAETDVFRAGHMPKRELFDRLSAFIDGLQAGIALAEQDSREDYRVTVEAGAVVETYLTRQKNHKAAEENALIRFYNENPGREATHTHTALIGGGRI